MYSRQLRMHSLLDNLCSSAGSVGTCNRGTCYDSTLRTDHHAGSMSSIVKPLPGVFRNTCIEGGTHRMPRSRPSRTAHQGARHFGWILQTPRIWRLMPPATEEILQTTLRHPDLPCAAGPHISRGSFQIASDQYIIIEQSWLI